MDSPKNPKSSFGCFPHKPLKLILPKSKSKSSSSSTKSIDSPKTSNNKSPMIMASQKSSRDEDFKEVFRRFDVDNNGKISAFELRNYFGSVREHITHEEAEAIIDGLDNDGDKMIDFNDFLKLMKGDGDSEKEDFKAAFEMFEFEKGCGRITPKSLQRLLNKLGDMKSYDDCVVMIRAYDVDGNGELDYYEFRQMMMT